MIEDPPRASILVVEDERIVARDVQQTLEELGYDAYAVASSADDAIAVAAERCPDLVLMDIRIRGARDGIEAATLLRERFGVAVVFLTAHADEATIARAKVALPHGYLVKPLRSDELQRTLELALFRHALERRSRERAREAESVERFGPLATMAAGISHEVNNPLAVVVANTDYAIAELEPLAPQLTGGAAAAVEAILEAQRETVLALDRIRRTLGDLRAFARPAEAAGGNADVGRAVQRALRAVPGGAGVEVAIEDGLPPVRLSPTRLEEVLRNVLVNASQAIVPGAEAAPPRIVVRARALGDRVAIAVEDAGTGMTPDVARRAFDPFFTTRPLGEGAGLGLSVCHGVVGSAGGTITLESVPGHGTTVTVVLPVAPPVRRSGVPSAPVARARILVVDDEAMVRQALARVLRDHDLVAVASGAAALEVLATEGRGFDLILSDVMMPGMTGGAFYEALVALDPPLARRVVFMSGGALSPELDDFLASIPNDRLDKPFDLTALLGAVRGALERGRAPAPRGW